MSLDYRDARMLDMTCGDLVWSDWKRGFNRGLINSLANGEKPFTDDEAENAGIITNVNDLKHTSLTHQGRIQYYNGFFQQGAYISLETDWGPRYKRDAWKAIVEKEVNRPLLESSEYYEAMQGKFASLILHGIAPAIWLNQDLVIPEELSVADLLVPVNTKRGFRNLPFVVVRKSFTGMELERLALSPKRDPGWNIEYVKRCLKWIDEQMRQGLDSTYNNFYLPEKWEEENKQQAGCYLADRVPTIDVFDIYAFVEGGRNNKPGWVRRMILDTWSNPGGGGPGTGNPPKPEKRGMGRSKLDKTNKGDFLYTSDMNIVADDWHQIVSVQYADLSAVSPFMHNSVRGLGWLAYAMCHIGNRLKCRFFDSAFEQLMQYFRVSSMDDVNRAMKVELAQSGFIDETIQMVKAGERWQPNAQWFELALGEVKNTIQDNTAGFTAQAGQGNQRTEKTKAQYLGELQQMNALVSAGLNQAYNYQKFEDREIVRRLFKQNSTDPVARDFRMRCLRQGVPQELINHPEYWDVQHERMMGQGNQTLEMMVALELVQMAKSFDPEGQRTVYRNAVMAMTHNPQFALELLPQTPNKNPPAAQQARWNCMTMLGGVPVPPPDDLNWPEYLPACLMIMNGQIQAGMKAGGMVDPKTLTGLQLIAQHVAQCIHVFSQDPENGPQARQFESILTKHANEIRAFQQRLQEAQKKQAKAQQGNGAGDGKAQAAMLKAQVDGKIKAAKAQQEMKHKEAKFQQDRMHDAVTTRADIASKDLETASKVRRNRMTSLEE